MKRSVFFWLTLVGLLSPFFLRPASAEFQFKKGSFLKTANPGVPVSQSIIGVGFQPKAVVFFWTRQDTEVIPPIGDPMVVGYGLASGPANERAVVIACDDFVGTSNCGTDSSDVHSILMTSDGTPSRSAEAELTSFDPSGFTLNWTLNEARADIIHYIAFGGSDITNALVSEFVWDAAASQSVTPGFQPDFVTLLSAGQTAAGASTHGSVYLGFASSPTEEAFVGTRSEDGEGCFGQPADSYVWQMTDHVMALMRNNGAADNTAELASFDPTGFTLNKDLNTTSGIKVYYLALQGGSYKVGIFDKFNNMPTQQSVSGVGFQPQAVLLASANKIPPTGSPGSQGRISFGASDGTTEGGIVHHDVDAPGFCGTTKAGIYTKTDKVAVGINMDQRSNPPLDITHEGDLLGFTADGFVLDWTTDIIDDHEIIYVAFGPTAHTNYRSIGEAADYSLGTVTATLGSAVVTGSGAQLWQGANRGRGDRINIGGTDYTVLSVDSETGLTLTSAFTGTTGSGKLYTISRQFTGPTALQDWENCISFGGVCTYFPASVSSANLVADNRSEVGIAYNDSPVPADPDFTAGVVIDGSTTDAAHGITLTADAGNRSYGVPGQGVVIDQGVTPTDIIAVQDDFVTVEFLELMRGGGGADGIVVKNLGASNRVVLRNLLIRNVASSGVALLDSSVILDAYNNIIVESGNRGIVIGFGPSAASIRIFNNTFYLNDWGIQAVFAGPYSNVTLQNNIAHSNTSGDFEVDTPNAASDHNLASDLTGTSHSPGGNGIDSVPLPNMNFVDDAPPGLDLHITAGSAAEDCGGPLFQPCALSGSFGFDVDGGARVTPWDLGADDIVATTAVELVLFETRALDGAVELTWETCSELNNLGFHLHRSSSEGGHTSALRPRLFQGWVRPQ